MDNVRSLADHAARRAAVVDQVRRDHPSLRWVAGTAFYIAHAKVDGAAECGAVGDLILAPPGVPLCVECFPLASRRPMAAQEQESV